MQFITATRNLMLCAALAVTASAASAAAAQSVVASQVGAAAPVVSTNITEAEVLAAQRAWGEALVRISSDYEAGGIAKAKATAGAVLDSAYGYGLGPVLFKPTLLNQFINGREQDSQNHVIQLALHSRF